MIVNTFVFFIKQIMNLKIEDVSAPRSFVFLWCGSYEGLDHGREVIINNYPSSLPILPLPSFLSLLLPSSLPDNLCITLLSPSIVSQEMGL